VVAPNDDGAGPVKQQKTKETVASRTEVFPEVAGPPQFPINDMAQALKILFLQRSQKLQ
jgi:hypothetical protein